MPEIKESPECPHSGCVHDATGEAGLRWDEAFDLAGKDYICVRLRRMRKTVYRAAPYGVRNLYT